jgi:parvulin-like peptidyl-prolyl isomerase
MRSAGFALLVCLSSAAAQTPPPQPAPIPDLPEETVIATFDDGVKMTMGEFKRFYNVLPGENRAQILQNRVQFLQQWALMRKLARMAEEEKLGEFSPARDELEYHRLRILSQAKMDHHARQVLVLPSDVSKFYEENRNRYKQVRVKAIYIGFDGKKLADAGAKAKAAQIAAQARGGADFVKLVRAVSDDPTTKAKDGDYGIFRLSDLLPEEVRSVVFSLGEGQVSDPVRQSNGYYIFRIEKIDVQPLEDVRDAIFLEVRQNRFDEWMRALSREATVLYNSPAFIGAVPAGTTGAPRK